MFEKPSEVWEDQMNDLFLVRKKDDTNQVIKAFSIILNQKYINNQDMVDAFNILGFDKFISLLTLFEKRTVTFPSKEEIKDAVIFAMVFYYRETKGYSWEEIRTFCPLSFLPYHFHFD